MQTSMQAPHRKQNHVLLAVRRQCQLLMHHATKGMGFFLSLPLCVTNCQSVPTQAASVAVNPLMSLRGRYNAKADLTHLTCRKGALPKKSKENSTCCFSFSDNMTCCLCCTSAYGDQIKCVFSSCFKDTYCEGAAK